VHSRERLRDEIVQLPPLCVVKPVVHPLHVLLVHAVLVQQLHVRHDAGVIVRVPHVLDLLLEFAVEYEGRRDGPDQEQATLLHLQSPLQLFLRGWVQVQPLEFVVVLGSPLGSHPGLVPHKRDEPALAVSLAAARRLPPPNHFVLNPHWGRESTCTRCMVAIAEAGAHTVLSPGAGFGIVLTTQG